MPRQTKLTPEVHRAIVESMRDGSYAVDAAMESGVHETTLYDWLARAEDPGEEDPRYASFRDDFEVASADAKRASLRRIRNGDKDWTGNAWFLERRHAKQFTKRVHNTFEVDKRLEEILSSVRGKMTSSAFRELLTAIDSAQANEPAKGTGGDTE